MTDSDSDAKPDDDAEREQAHEGSRGTHAEAHASSQGTDADAHASSQGTDAEAHGGHGAEQSGPGGDAQAGSGETPGVGGYAGRDPKSDMPRVPTSPQTQDDADD